MIYSKTAWCFVSLTISFLCNLHRRNYFEEEEVDLNEFTTSWLQYLLSKEMKFDNLVRLWGRLLEGMCCRMTWLILSSRFIFLDAWSVRISPICLSWWEYKQRTKRSVYSYYCIAILRNARENLEDLEQSEIRTMLLRLPFMDMQPVSISTWSTLLVINEFFYLDNRWGL